MNATDRAREGYQRALHTAEGWASAEWIIQTIAADIADAEREARSAALAEAAAVCDARAADFYSEAPHLYSGIDYGGLARAQKWSAKAIRALAGAPASGETKGVSDE